MSSRCCRNRTLWVLGHGRVAECLSRFGATLGFRVVVDDTPAPEPARFPDAVEIIGDDYDYAAADARGRGCRGDRHAA